MKLAFALTIAALLALVSAEAASAASCSGWHATCLKRVADLLRRGDVRANTQICDYKFSECLSSGCWTAQTAAATAPLTAPRKVFVRSRPGLTGLQL